jgi:two-component system cell cycle sensor histidine kinase/response regulator CckA
MTEPIRVLIVEDDPTDADLVVRELRRAGFVPDWVRVESESEYLSCLDRIPDIVLSDSSLPEFDGLRALDLLRQRSHDIPFILVSGRMGEDLAVDAMKRGADDYLLKDRLARLGEAVRRAMERRRLKRERGVAIEALRQSEERYRLVSEISSDYVYSLSVEPDGSLLCEWITERFTRISGFTASEINFRGWRNLYHPEDHSVSDRHHSALLSGQSDSVELRILSRDGQARWVRLYGRPIRDEKSGRVVRIYGAAQDITGEKQLEHQLLQSQKMEAIGLLAGGVAHDFNNLLTIISGYGQILREQAEPPSPNAEYLDAILEAADRASQLTRQLLAFSRRQVLQIKLVDLNSIVAGVEKMLKRVIGEDIELRTVAGSNLGLVKVDPGQIEQVIMNLAVNARDAMPAGGRLSIETANAELDEAYFREHGAVEPGPYVMLAVSDTGGGMDQQTLARIFEPFFTTKEPGRGTGLGLAMVYGIIKQSGGNIWVYSELGQGTTFKLYLPRVLEEGKLMDDSKAQLPRSAQGSETILVVEDENAVRGLIRQVLSREGYTVLDTGEVEEALEICEKHAGNISLLITDVILPRMSGPQVAEQALKLSPGLRVMYTSGYTDNALIQHGLVQQTVTLLEKPFTPGTLSRKVREVLDAPLVA